MSNRSKGFTLIELLVVIAIIGILAALVLVALGNARTKAQDARLKSNVGQLRTLAEVFYDENNASYSGFETCLTTPNATNCGTIVDSVSSLVTDIEDSTSGLGKTLTHHDTATAFCIETTLVSDATTDLCVDATGAFLEGTAACDDTTADCATD